MLCGCSSAGKQAAETEEGLPVINLSENVEQVSALHLSDAVDHVDIVRLETTDQSLIGRLGDIKVTSEDIWVHHFSDERIYRFSRDGKFRNTVGKIGQGPEEYISTENFYVDDENKELYIMTPSSGIRVYDYEGNYKRGQHREFHQKAFSAFVAKNGMIFKDGEIILSQQLYLSRIIPEDSIWSLAWVDRDFNIQKIYENPAHVGREAEIIKNSPIYDPRVFMDYYWEEQTAWDVYGNELTFKFADTDTIYLYNKENRELQPQYIIYSSEEKGDYADTHRIAKDIKDFNYFTIKNYFPARDYIYLIAYKGPEIRTYRYDRRDHSVQMARRDIQILSRRFSVTTRHFFENEGDTHFYLNDDIFGGRFHIKTRAEGKYWIDILQPGFPEYDEAVEELRNSPDAPRKQELLNIIDQTDDEDNPILLIAVLK